MKTTLVKPASAQSDMPDVPAPKRWASLTPRAVIISLVLIPLLIFWLEFTESIARGPDMAGMSLPMAVVFALLLIVAVNLGLKRWLPSHALSQAELLVIYSMTSVAFWIGGLGMLQFLSPALIGWRYYATPTNAWDRWWHDIPAWAVPDASVVQDYYDGRSSLLVHLGGWARPIAIWTVFIFVLLFCMYCINTLMRRQWVEREKLLFPIVVIPLEITRNGGDGPLWRSKLFWGGAALAMTLETMATIHYTMAPAFPYVPIKPREPGFDLGLLAASPPWNAIGQTQIAFYPLVIGMAYLLSLDVSFSCWFFYLLAKGENVASAAFGLRDAATGAGQSTMPYIAEQAVGAFLGLAFLALYFARPHLKAAWGKAFLGDKSMDDADEPMSYRAAFIGLFVSIIALVSFAVALGLALPLALIFWTVFFLFALAFTRIRAEAGLPWGHGPTGLSHTNMVNMAGTHAFREQDLTSLSMMRWFDSDWRCMGQPGELETMKLGSSAGPLPVNPRHLTAAVFVAIVVGTLAAWVSCLGLYYHYGASSATVDTWRTGQGHYGFDELQSWLNNPRPTDTARITAAGAGLIIVCMLSLLRTHFVWWPLHPIGYAIGCTDTMGWIWFPVIIGWFLKMLLLRYGGIKIYRQALPFFLGLVLGDYVASCLWSLYFLSTGHPGYRTFPI